MKRARSEQDKESRKHRILDAALHAFFDNGFSASRMDDIAKRADISKGTLYLYYPSKDAIFAELVDKIALPKLSQIEQLANSAVSFEQILQHFVALALNLLNDGQLPKLMKIVISDSGAFPDQVILYRQNVVDKALAAMTSLIESAQQRGEVRSGDAREIAQLIVAPVIFSVIWRVVFEPGGADKICLSSLLQQHICMLKLALCVDGTVC